MSGFEALAPMTLGDVSDAASVHESTVSRVFRKYTITTRDGIKPLKYFLSTLIKGDGENIHSAKVVIEMVARAIGSEDPRKPLSDNKIAEFLAQEGYGIARRTVAKYRESLSIPPASKRKVKG